MLPEEILRRAETLADMGIYYHPIYAMQWRVQTEHYKATGQPFNERPETLTGEAWKQAKQAKLNVTR